MALCLLKNGAFNLYISTLEGRRVSTPYIKGGLDINSNIDSVGEGRDKSTLVGVETKLRNSRCWVVKHCANF